MKIITDNAIYVQKSDLKFLDNLNIPMSKELYMKIYSCGVYVVDDGNIDKFIKFDLEEEIEFFKNIDFILDYNRLISLKKSTLVDMYLDMLENCKSKRDKINGMTAKEIKNNIEIINQYHMLNYELSSFDKLLSFKNGDISIELPDGMEPPKVNILKRFLKKRINEYRDNLKNNATN